ncbi:WD-repeat protein [Reticulomyxa filosa]|uniref:WD-repeat protein n=1 Tax=Reticulomyxa filosa TaxID=46433 RepID=X6MSK9_RETFI|nr:WD-repeat protein [Reticulomyxa filosa]|eukprot:ETO16095.1 WD-repeat protein [Reticulomyxa filosa]
MEIFMIQYVKLKKIVFDVPSLILKEKSSNIFSSYNNLRLAQKEKEKMTTHINEKQTSTRPALLTVHVYNVLIYLFCVKLLEDIQVVIQHWIRILNITLGWIHDFDKIVVNYVMFPLFFIFIQSQITVFMFDVFISSSKLINTFTGHSDIVWSIDYSILGDGQFICSGSADETVRVWDVENNKQIQSFNKHSSAVACVKFSSYHYHNYRRNVICSASVDRTIRFWDFKDNKELQIFNKHTGWIGGIEFSPFNGGRYLCSGSEDNTICLWDVETSKLLHVLKGHKDCVRSVDISSLQSNNNKNESNSIGVIGGNGYNICSGSFDNTIILWDIETAKQLIVFKGHSKGVMNVKYGSNEFGCANTILSGSNDESVRLWDVRSGEQIQVFNGHERGVYAVEYSPFVIKNNSEAVSGNSNVICSGSVDNTIRFWDIRSNKNKLQAIKGDEKKKE